MSQVKSWENNKALNLLMDSWAIESILRGAAVIIEFSLFVRISRISSSSFYELITGLRTLPSTTHSLNLIKSPLYSPRIREMFTQNIN